MGNFLADLGVGRARQAKAAVLFLDDRAEQSEVGHLVDDFLRPDVVVLEFHDMGADVSFEKLLQRL